MVELAVTTFLTAEPEQEIGGGFSTIGPPLHAWRMMNGIVLFGVEVARLDACPVSTWSSAARVSRAGICLTPGEGLHTAQELRPYPKPEAR
jgi:hypothetical protein